MNTIFTGMINKLKKSFPKELHIQHIMNNIDQLKNKNTVSINGKTFTYINSVGQLVQNLSRLKKISNLVVVIPNNSASKFGPLEVNLPLDSKVIPSTEFENYLARTIISSSSNNGGVGANDLGDFGEKRVVNTFLNKNNVHIWNNFNHSLLNMSYNYNIFKSILDTNSKLKALHDHQNPASKISKVINVYTGLSNYKGTPQFNKQLASERGGGKPKTDESATIVLTNGVHIIFNISVKTPLKSTTQTTVHQGKVSDLINDLKKSMPDGCSFKDPSKLQKLNTALTHFQTNGGFNLKKKNCPITSDDLEFLNNNISELLPWLTDYFFFGRHNSRQHGIQIANTITLFNSSNGLVNSYNYKDIINKVLHQKRSNRKNNPLSSNTPFGWTCPSKVHGTEIQVKAKFGQL